MAAEREQRAARGAAPPDVGESLPNLVARLGEDVVTLVDTKLALLKVEIKDDVAAYVEGSASLIVSVGIATVGIGLVALAIAFVVSHLLASTALTPPLRYAVGTGFTGATCLAGGYVLWRRTVGRLARVDPLPERSIAEVAKDKRWLGT